MPYAVRVLDPDLQRALADPSDRYWRGKPPHIHRRVHQIISRLRQNPYDLAGSHPLVGEFRSLRAARLTDRWRLIFKICEECRRNGAQAIHPLDCCRSGETLDQTINLLEIVDYHTG